MLIEAVRLSVLAEARFDPALGNSFATYVAIGSGSYIGSPRSMTVTSSFGWSKMPR